MSVPSACMAVSRYLSTDLQEMESLVQICPAVTLNTMMQDSDEDGQDVRAIAQRLQQLSQATTCSEQAASEVTEMLFPVPSIREINDALPSRAGSRSCPAEAHMARSLTMLATWLHSANSPYTR